MLSQLDAITTVDDLKYHLIQAMRIEHATIPPYLTALYSIKPGSNLAAFHILRSVAVEEMLHMTLAANIFNAIGGNIKEVLTDSDFIPNYPVYLPLAHDRIEISIGEFSPKAIATFLQLELSNERIEDNSSQSKNAPATSDLDVSFCDEPFDIGLFYLEIIKGIEYLYQQKGDDLFCGDRNKQISPEYFYNGAGSIIPVTDIQSAIAAIEMIRGQGQGANPDVIYDSDGRLSHYFRFQQLQRERLYKIDELDLTRSDKPNSPTGDVLSVDWDAVFPILENATLSDYPIDSEVYNRALDFRTLYHQFLANLEAAFDGRPTELMSAISEMFRLRELSISLMRNPIPGCGGVHAAPVFK